MSKRKKENKIWKVIKTVGITALVVIAIVYLVLMFTR